MKIDTNKDAKNRAPKGEKTIRLNFNEPDYGNLLCDINAFKAFLDENIKNYPDLFPPDIKNGYKLNGKRGASKKTSISYRRITITQSGETYSILPSFVMPYMTEKTDVAWKIYLLWLFCVPIWVLALVFETDQKHIQRMVTHLGNCNLLGSTVRGNTQIPNDLVADEKHSWLKGVKKYLATIVSKDCILCSQISDSASEDDLTAAYGKFKEQALEQEPDYNPYTVNTDGWTATGNAFKNLFSSITIIFCFLHAILSIKNVAVKKTKELFEQTKEKAWNIYRAKDKHSFAQGIRRFKEWAVKMADNPIKEKILKLCHKKYSFIRAFDFENAYRTSNMIDRTMDFMDKFLYHRKYLHGKKETSQKTLTAFCLAFNFRPYCAQTVKQQGGITSPFEKLNGFVYHPNFLHNLLIATSRNGRRNKQPKKT